ncbi:MAG: glycogen-binding domain-containing protein, partial [Myxococcaceae bacterium]
MADAPGTSISFTWHGPHGQQVELAGDFPDWKYPIAMREEPPGCYRCQLELEPGVYRYKFRLNRREWIPD